MQLTIIVNRFIRTNIYNLAGVPSIIYGMLGLAIFVRALNSFTSGAMFEVVDPPTANGRTILSAGLTLGLLILPMIIIDAQKQSKQFPTACAWPVWPRRHTWQTIWHHVLPNALPGILTGAILSISRAFGETAPLVVVGLPHSSPWIQTDPFQSSQHYPSRSTSGLPVLRMNFAVSPQPQSSYY